MNENEEEVHVCCVPSCDSIDTTWEIDPFLLEVDEVEEWNWFCKECLEQRRMDI